MQSIHLLLISGSTRAASTNTALLRTLQTMLPAGMTATLYRWIAALPHFTPDDDRASGSGGNGNDTSLHPAVADLRQEIAAADLVLFSTPEYAGAMPGSFKNLLDWTVGGGEIYRKPVAWLNASSSPTGAAHAHASLATVLGYLNVDVIDAVCRRLPVSRAQVGADGLIADPAVRAQLGEVLIAIAGALTLRDASSQAETSH
jgi:chromate reductase, NAD(P)H dehydrogenase (quinone)